MSRIDCKAISKSYGDVVAVDNLDLVVEPGEIAALVGPSGCGKTTALRLIAGFERPDQGVIKSDGRVLADDRVFVPPEKRRVGMVFQEYALFPHMSVSENVAYGIAGAAAPNGESRARDLLKLVGLERLGKRYPHELSGGQQQRVALARALAPGPDVVLLDEPFSSLDAGLRDRVRQEVREILGEARVTAIFVTHDQEEALSLADKVAVMNSGRIEHQGTPESVYGKPTNRWLAAFLGGANIVPGEAGDGWVECEISRFGINPGFTGPADVVIRPESIALAHGGPTPSGESGAQGVVVKREFYGHDQLVHVELASGLTLRSRRLGFPAWHPGDHVRVWVEGPVTVLPPGTDPVGACSIRTTSQQ